MSDQSFKDYFSKQSVDYAQFRPTYPAALFECLAELTPDKGIAWDCATGTGQAACELARHYRQVFATDASAAQINQAKAVANVKYRVCTAEDSGLESASVDVVVVAQALHWFNLEAFYREVERVLKPGGCLAVLSYAKLTLSPQIDTLIEKLYTDVLGSYWPPERRFVEEGYQALEFPYQPLELPAFAMQANWSLAELLGYFQTWSAVQRYQESCHCNPIEDFIDAFVELWGEPQKRRTISWPLALRVGRVPDK